MHLQQTERGYMQLTLVWAGYQPARVSYRSDEQLDLIPCRHTSLISVVESVA